MNYTERAPLGVLGKAMVFVFPVLILVINFLFWSLPVPFEARLIQAIVSIIVILALTAFWFTTFGFNSKEVTASFGPIKYSVSFKDIESVQVVSVPWYFGLGVRMYFWKGNTIGFITRHNKAVELRKKTGFFKRVLLTTRDPEAFAEKIKKTTKHK